MDQRQTHHQVRDKTRVKTSETKSTHVRHAHCLVRDKNGSDTAISTRVKDKHSTVGTKTTFLRQRQKHTVGQNCEQFVGSKPVVSKPNSQLGQYQKGLCPVSAKTLLQVRIQNFSRSEPKHTQSAQVGFARATSLWSHSQNLGGGGGGQISPSLLLVYLTETLCQI